MPPRHYGLPLWMSLALGLTLALGVGGCSSDPVGSAGKPPAPWNGRWLLTTSQSAHLFELCVLDISSPDGTPVVHLASRGPSFEKTELKSAEITGDDIHLIFTTKNVEFDFLAAWDGEQVRGSLLVPKMMLVPAVLIPTDLSSVPERKEPPEVPGLEQFRKILSDKNPFPALEQFMDQFPYSPLVMDCYGVLVGSAESRKLPEAEVRKLVDRFRQAAAQWGPRMAPRADFDAGALLSRQEYLPDLARELLTKAEAAFDPNMPPTWKANLATGWVGLGEAKKALDLVEPLHDESPLDALLTHTLARGLEATGKPEEALPLYAELVALPGQEQTLTQLFPDGSKALPRHRAEELWKAKHGSDAGFDDYLLTVYRDRLASLSEAPSERPERPAQGRTVLLELFTGGGCPPCVAADLAAGLIEKSYDPAEVVILRYHQHVPPFDPLANNQTSERFDYYSGRGTPATFVNGEQISGFAGGLEAVVPVYQGMQELLGPMIQETTNLKIELQAVRDQDDIQVTAKVTGKAKLPESYRLRFVLVEDGITYPAMNGVLVHDSIARAMLGGPRGFRPKGGKLEYTGTLSLADLRANLKQEVDGFAAAYKSKVGKLPPPETLDQHLDFKDLRLIAFLQNEDDKKILQTVTIPVSSPAAAALPTPTTSR